MNKLTICGIFLMAVTAITSLACCSYHKINHELRYADISDCIDVCVTGTCIDSTYLSYNTPQESDKINTVPHINLEMEGPNPWSTFSIDIPDTILNYFSLLFIPRGKSGNMVLIRQKCFATTPFIIIPSELQDFLTWGIYDVIIFHNHELVGRDEYGYYQ
jgi:hypothetical protein